MPTDPGSKARGKLNELEKRRQLAVVSQFQKIRDRLEREIAELVERIDKQRVLEGNASPGLILQKARLGEILDAVTNEIQDTSKRLAAITESSQSRAVDIARNQSAEYPELRGDLGFFDSEATKELIGVAMDGGPLDKTFAAIAKPVRLAIFEALEFGIASGSSNYEIAREIKEAIGGGTARAMTIVRTETNRAYREASRKFYGQAPGVIGWRWLAALDLRTCPLCWALHGKIFRTNTKFGTHPNCRCTMVPVFEGDERVLTGPEAFERLNETQKKAILGPARYQLHLDGAELKDFVGQVRTPFGIGRVVKPVRETKFKKRETPRTPVPPVPVKPTGGATPTARPKPFPPSPTPKPALGSRAQFKPGTSVPAKFDSSAAGVAYMEQRFPAIRWDFGKMDLELMQKQIAELTARLDEFPAVADRLKYVGTYVDKTKILVFDSGRFAARTYAHCENSGRYIAFNPKYYSDKPFFRERKKEALRVGWSVSDADQSTATHEFGHAVHSAMNAEKHKSFFPFYFADGRTEVGTILNRVLRNLKPSAGQMSRYGTTNPSERFAEGFSMFYNRPAKDFPPFVRAQRILIERFKAGKIYGDDELTEFRNLSDADKEQARAAFKAFMDELGLKEPK